MSAKPNASMWATTQLNKFFRGYPASLTGQCVSLVKWFLQEMTSVPNPQAARGHAKDFGNTLVAQGHAKRVSSPLRKRGDIVVWPFDGGGYGHIGVLASRNAVFEENVGLKGTPSKVVAGQRVYASRIDPLVASWRVGSPRYYRVKTYKEAPAYTVKYNHSNLRTRPTTRSESKGTRNKGYKVYIRDFVAGERVGLSDKWGKTWNKNYIHSSLIKKK